MRVVFDDLANGASARVRTFRALLGHAGVDPVPPPHREAGLGVQPDTRPELWIAAGLAPGAYDPTGPASSAALGIPYLIAEPGLGWDRAEREPARVALERASLVVTSSAASAAGVGPLLRAGTRLERIPPCLDIAPLRAAAKIRPRHRAALAAHLRLQDDAIWLVTEGEMREGPSLDSWRLLARALSRIPMLEWNLVVLGDGPARAQAVEILSRLPRDRVRWRHSVTAGDRLALLVSGDLFLWPALDGEGADTLLEAQAGGMAAVACRGPDAGERVQDGRTGRLAAAANAESFANVVAFLLRHPRFRLSMGKEAATTVANDHDIRTVAPVVRRLLREAAGLVGR